MLKIKTSSIRPGMQLSKSIYSDEGQLLIDNGVKFKKSIIEKLENYKIESVYIKWDREEESEVTEAIIEATKEEALTLLKQSIGDIQSTKKLAIDRIKKVVSDIIEELLSKKGTLVNLTSIRTIDDHTFIHSINVCILSLIMGFTLEYNTQQLESLGTGSLLHDLGKVGIEPHILNKPGALTYGEHQIIKKHAIFGYEMIKNVEGLSEESICIIRDHHERYDGKGYPLGKRSTEIHEFARVVAICDVYDALTSNRVYRFGMPPHIGVEYLISMGGYQFDQNLVKTFIKHICLYPEGTLVELESGEKGVVIESNKIFPTRPVVKILFDQSGKKLNKLVAIDLGQHLNNGIISRVK